MNTTTARLTVLEQVVSRIATSRGPKVSAMLREARVRVQAGEPTAPILRDLAELERQARGTGVRADMARAALRIARGPASDGLHTPGVVAKDAAVDGGAGGGDPPSGMATCSTSLQHTAAGHSANGALVDRIDELLATAHG